jgi:predicted N-acetyltransferase YhbS
MYEYIFKGEDDLSKKDREQLRDLLVPLFSFSYHFTQSYQREGRLYYSSKPKWRLLVKDGNELIGSLSIVERHITKPFDLTIGGIGNVGVAQNYQKKGLATGMLHEAHGFMKQKGINLSLLFCIERLKPVYIKAGYLQIKKPVTYIDGNGKPGKEELALFFPISLDRKTAALIQFHGLDIGRGTW